VYDEAKYTLNFRHQKSGGYGEVRAPPRLENIDTSVPR